MVVERLVALEIAEAAMEVARARLTHHYDTGAAHTPVLGLVVVEQHLDLRNGVRADVGGGNPADSAVLRLYTIHSEADGVSAVAVNVHADREVPVWRNGNIGVRHPGEHLQHGDDISAFD